MESKSKFNKSFFIINFRHKILEFFENVLSDYRKKLVYDLEVSQYRIVGTAFLKDAMLRWHSGSEDIETISNNCEELGRIIIRCFNVKTSKVYLPNNKKITRKLCKGIEYGEFFNAEDAVKTLFRRAGFIDGYYGNYFPSHYTLEALILLEQIRK